MATEKPQVSEGADVVSGDIAQTGFGLGLKRPVSAVDARGLSGKTTDEEMKHTLKKGKKKMRKVKRLKSPVKESEEEFPGYQKFRIKEGVVAELDLVGPGDIEEYPEDDEEYEYVEDCGCDGEEEPHAHGESPLPPDTDSFVTDMIFSIKEIKERLGDMEYKLMLILSKKKS